MRISIESLLPARMSKGLSNWSRSFFAFLISLFSLSLLAFFFSFIFYEQRSNFLKDTLFFVSHVPVGIYSWIYFETQFFFWLNFWRKEIECKKKKKRNHWIKISIRQKREAHRNGIRINKSLSISPSWHVASIRGIVHSARFAEVRRRKLSSVFPSTSRVTGFFGSACAHRLDRQLGNCGN